MITILDGGMGKHLHAIGAPFRQPEWSALALMESDAHVASAHQNFIAAGADVIITNTYAVVPFHIGTERFAADGDRLVRLAAEIARQVADDSTEPVRVAGSIPPACGSYLPEEFDPEVAPGIHDVTVRNQVGLVDFWLAETMSSTREFEAIAAAVQRHDPTAEFWASFTVVDDPIPAVPTIRSGERFEDVVAAVLDSPVPVSAVLLNCSQPEAITPAVELLASLLADHDIAVGAYANAFPDKDKSTYNANAVVLGAREDLTISRYAEMAQLWIDAGATIVGGCCGIQPEHIAGLRDSLNERALSE